MKLDKDMIIYLIRSKERIVKIEEMFNEFIICYKKKDV